ncbi:MAG: hypothetical protein HZA05_02505 [Nitrospirae bacterium]|nr:hypothetical protein [Nitrospirota bacterium]
MRRIFVITTLLFIGLFLLTATTIAAEATSIKITKCEYNDEEKTLTLEYNLVKGPKGDHVHLWIDGKEKKPVKQPKGYKLTGVKLSKGEHKVELKVADSSHTPIGVNDTYELVVK